MQKLATFYIPDLGDTRFFGDIVFWINLDKDRICYSFISLNSAEADKFMESYGEGLSKFLKQCEEFYPDYTSLEKIKADFQNALIRDFRSLR